jgi:hypothetical protein
MSESTDATKPKEGFWKKIIDRVDRSLKAKADAKAEQGCCGGDKGKGGSCC